MFLFDQSHIPFPGHRNPTQGTENQIPYNTAPGYPDPCSLHRGAPPKVGQFANASRRTSINAPHDAPEKFLQGSSQQDCRSNALDVQYNTNWSIDQMIAWLAGRDGLAMYGTDEIARGTVVHGGAVPDGALSDGQTAGYSSATLERKQEDGISPEKPTMGRREYGMACASCRIQKVRCVPDVDGATFGPCKKYMLSEPTHICARQENIGQRGRPKSVLNGQGKNSLKQGHGRDSERKKTQESVKRTACVRKQRADTKAVPAKRERKHMGRGKDNA
ncbi:hypothetical protein OBBRIDRAFT_829022 [Obba rivulosa]|uniref:Zn(2)-C6 fungal-type domain-containing protein n=1 Tax=Obba rivulosa TaxID=1052685 RepID=A0A8E2ANV1_9APHY|nr:hypothetical protein OBBRIDRAFT_829022 [Obba rivulosa]